ncbi:MAG: hypothetical protein WD872_11940, partial [Pirellulaceae bacterium]
MGDGSAIVMFLFAVILTVAIAVASIIERQKHNEILQRIAQRFRGKLMPGAMFTPAEIRLRFQGYPAVFKHMKVGKHSVHTTFTIRWPDDKFRLEIYPQDGFSGFRRLWGMEDIEIGSGEFDRSFFISGNGVVQAREMLTTDVQNAIFQLAQLGVLPAMFGTRVIQVKFSSGLLTII